MKLPAWLTPPRIAAIAVGTLGVGGALWWVIWRATDQSGDAQPGPPVADPPNPDNASWAGSQRVAERAVPIAQALGARVTSRKRDDSATLRAGSTRGSDHHVGNLTAYAIDFGVRSDLAVGDRVFEGIRKLYGIDAKPGSYTRHEIVDQGQRFSIQLLWRVKDHFDHVHLGVRRVGTESSNVSGLGGVVIEGPWLKMRG